MVWGCCPSRPWRLCGIVINVRGDDLGSAVSLCLMKGVEKVSHTFVEHFIYLMINFSFVVVVLLRSINFSFL